MSVYLNQLIEGESAVVQAVHGEDCFALRMYDAGLIPGTRIQVSQCAPRGDPMVVHLRGFALALKKREAAYVEVAWER